LSGLLRGDKHTYREGLNAADESWDEQLGIFRKPQTMSDWFQVYQNDINKRVGKSQAFSIRARFLKGLAGSYGSMRPEDQATNLKALKGQVSDSAIEQLRGGDTSGILSEAENYKNQARVEHDKMLILQARKTQDLNDERPTASAERQKEIDSEIQEIQGKTLEEQSKYNDELESGRDALLDMVRALEAQKELTKEVASAFKGIGLDEYSQKLIALQYQVSLNDAMMNNAKDPEIKDRLEKESDLLRAQLDVAKNPLSQQLDLVNRNAGIATKIAGGEVESQGVGLSEGEKLLDRRRYISQEMVKLSNLQKDSANDLLRYEVLLSGSRETQLSISQRILEVDKERKQTAIDTQREFQKTLIGAGPGELLRKLAEAQLAGKNGSRIRTAGQIFSLTGESQRDVYGLMGGERMAGLNAEARALRGHGENVTGTQQTSDRINTRVAEVAAEYAKRIFPNGNAVFVQASKALNNTSSAADRLTASFDKLRIKVESVSFGGAAPATTTRAPSATPVPQAADDYTPTAF
jgi:hypothetical protein